MKLRTPTVRKEAEYNTGHGISAISNEIRREIWCEPSRPESLFRVMRKLGMLLQAEKTPVYKPKPYEQMTYPGQRVQTDVKVVPRK